MMQNFKKHFLYLTKKQTASSKLLYNHILDLIFTECSKKFDELLDIILNSPDFQDEGKLGYIKEMVKIKEKWSSAHQPVGFNSGIHTNS